MNIKRISYLTIFALLLCIGVTIVKAYTVRNFDFYKVGDYEESVESLTAGDAYLNAYNFSANVDAVLGLSLSKKNLLGYSYISRSNQSTKGKSNVSATWENQKKGTYKGSIVLNTSNDNKTLSGNFYLKRN